MDVGFGADQRLEWRLTDLRMRLALMRMRIALKAGFRPNQPRLPRGHPDGGQWTRVPGYARIHRVGRRRAGGGQISIGGRRLPISPAQEVRLAIASQAAREAVAATRRLDPAWRPTPQLSNSAWTFRASMDNACAWANTLDCTTEEIARFDRPALWLSWMWQHQQSDGKRTLGAGSSDSYRVGQTYAHIAALSDLQRNTGRARRHFDEEVDAMVIRKLIAPPYLQFFVSDASLPENPVQGVEKTEIITNGQCLSVPCAYWDEADTDLLVGTPEEVADKTEPQFDTFIPTPSGSVVFSDAELTELLRYPTTSTRTRIRIWTDGQTFPEKIVVAIG